MEFPIEFPKCPKCGSIDTVCRQACENEPSIPKGTFVSLEKRLTPIQDFSKVSLPTTKVLIRHYDTCAKCGLDRCTRVEKTTMPTDALMRMMGMNPQAPQRR